MLVSLYISIYSIYICIHLLILLKFNNNIETLCLYALKINKTIFQVPISHFIWLKCFSNFFYMNIEHIIKEFNLFPSNSLLLLKINPRLVLYIVLLRVIVIVIVLSFVLFFVILCERFSWFICTKAPFYICVCCLHALCEAFCIDFYQLLIVSCVWNAWIQYFPWNLLLSSSIYSWNVIVVQ